MDEKDLKIRKQWLCVFILNMAMSALWSLLNSFFNPLMEGIHSVPALIGSGIGLIGFGYAIFHCVYKKPGTKLVTVLLVMGTLNLLITPVLALTGKMQLPYFLPFYAPLQTVSYLLAICWIIVCWKIRKVNRKLRPIAAAK